MKIFLPFGFTLFLFTFGCNPRVLMNHTHSEPGQTWRIEVADRLYSPSRLTRENFPPIPFYKTENGSWRALWGVPLDQLAGDTTFYVESDLSMKGLPSRIPVPVKIDESKVGFETIFFPKNKKAMLNNPAEIEESSQIHRLLTEAQTDSQQHWKGLFIWPVQGKILSPFGTKRNKVGQKKPSVHKGLDLEARRGDPVLASNEGVVLLAKKLFFHGNTVFLNHGQGVGTIYLHMNSILVQEGESVKKGQKIGEVGSTGLATAPHLHWGLYVQSEPVNPLQWLEEQF